MTTFKIEINDDDEINIIVQSLQYSEELLKNENDDCALKTRQAIKDVLHYYMIPQKWEERYNEQYLPENNES